MTQLAEMVELSGAELDAVSGGVALAQGGLANVAVNVEDVEILTDRGIVVVVNDTLKDIANNNKIGVGVLANILGGPALLLQRA